jgi:FixJ family two-component response regulator
LAETPVICIIDDDESVRVATRSLVRSLGFAAYTFDSAEAFLVSPRLDDASCLISDVRMPAMSGVELQDRLQSIGRTIPIIFITAFPDDAIRARAMNAGAVAVLTKPFYGETLIKCIDSVLKRKDKR